MAPTALRCWVSQAQSMAVSPEAAVKLSRPSRSNNPRLRVAIKPRRSPLPTTDALPERNVLQSKVAQEHQREFFVKAWVVD